MPDNRRRTPARLIAPIALLAFAFALFTVLSDSGGTGGESETAGQSASESAEPATDDERDAPARPRRRATYTVKVGDSLGLIAGKTGVEVEDLEDLNPDVDAQALRPGQKLKLRE